MAGEAYVKRYVGGFVDLPSLTTPEDSQFLNAVEAALLRLLGADPVDQGVQVWDAALARMKSIKLTNVQVDAAAAIARSKLDFGGGLVNADVAVAAAIAYSKLQLAGSIVNADISAAAAILGSKLATGLAGPPGAELAYNELTTNVSVVATSEATANTIVTASAFTFDGATPVWVDFFSPQAAKGTTRIDFYLYDGAASIGNMGEVVGATGCPVHLRRKLTPSAASHTYSVRASVDAGTGTVVAGVGGLAALMPCFIRITKA